LFNFLYKFLKTPKILQIFSLVLYAWQRLRDQQGIGDSASMRIRLRLLWRSWPNF
jgi:hypothetical protein